MLAAFVGKETTLKFALPKSVLLGSAVGVVIVAGLVSLSAMAQQPPPAGGPQHGEMKPHHSMCMDMDAREAGKLAFASVKLNITDAQKGAWGQFADKMKAADAPMHQLCTQMQGKPHATLPERLALMDQLAAAHATKIHLVSAAVGQLYGQLTPEQKQIADHVLVGHGHRHHGGMHHGWGDKHPDGGMHHGPDGAAPQPPTQP
jgi:hypothetical protein